MRDCTALEALQIPTVLLVPEALMGPARDALAILNLCDQLLVFTEPFYGRSADQIKGAIVARAPALFELCFAGPD